VSARAIFPGQLTWLTILKKEKNTTKTQLLPSFCMVDQQKKLNNFKTRQGPSTHIVSATFSDPNPYTTIPVEGISYILSYQTWKTGKKMKSYEAQASPDKPCGPYMAL
jgi:hypothetical protein